MEVSDGVDSGLVSCNVVRTGLGIGRVVFIVHRFMAPAAGSSSKTARPSENVPKVR
jgi:hypothetical protein